MARLREGYQSGDFKFELKGKRLRGTWVLVRLRRGDPRKPQWLLIKHRDEFAKPGSDIVAEADTSIATGRTMDQIAGGPAAKGILRGIGTHYAEPFVVVETSCMHAGAQACTLVVTRQE